MMTQEELDALRDVTPSFGMQEQEFDGKVCFVPIEMGFAEVLYQKAGDGVFTDQKTGDQWIVGWYMNRRVKRRLGVI